MPSNSLMESSATPRVFVTGGSGLVGAHLITRLVTAGLHVSAVYRKNIPTFPLADKVNWIEGDILDVIFLEEALVNIDQLYHCAAVVSFNPADHQSMMLTNVEGTANVVNVAIKNNVGKLCYVSSVAALGKQEGPLALTELSYYTKQLHNSNYGQSKYLAETEVWRGIGEGLNAVIVNPAIILGASDWNHGSSQLFKSVYDGFPWYSEGTNGFVDVADVVSVMMQLMQSDITGEKFIVSTNNFSYKDIFYRIADAFHKKPPHKKVTPLLAAIVWRLEALKAGLIGKNPLVTKETASDALMLCKYDNSKLFKYLPTFSYTPMAETIQRVCVELKARYQLS